MGWAFSMHEGRRIGYGVVAKCDHPGCAEIIDRGLAYACGGEHGEDEPGTCAGYFCPSHLFAHDCAATSIVVVHHAAHVEGSRPHSHEVVDGVLGPAYRASENG